MKQMIYRSARVLCLLVPIVGLGSLAAGCHHDRDDRGGYRDYHHDDFHDHDRDFHDHDHDYDHH